MKNINKKIFIPKSSIIDWINQRRAARKLSENWELEYVLDFKLLSKDLPFKMDRNQVFYVEKNYNERINRVIRKNYNFIREIFYRRGMLNFVYFPIYMDEFVSYNAPALSEQERKNKTAESFSFIKYLISDVDYDSFLICTCINDNIDKDGNIRVKCIPFNVSKFFVRRSIAKIALHLFAYKIALEDIVTFLKRNSFVSSKISYKEEAIDKDDESSLLFRSTIDKNDKKHEIDYEVDIETLHIVEEIKSRMNLLHDKGISTYFLHKLIDETTPLSRLRITKDFRIFLPDYNDKEILIDPLPKVVFIFFLRHIEGIRFKDIQNYKDELYQIYCQIRPNIKAKKREKSIASLTDPLSNSLNEKCARIREAFIVEFEESLARNYYITGRRGEPKRIILDKSLIEWE